MLRPFGFLLSLGLGLSLATPALACTLTLGWEPFEPFQVQEGETVGGLDVSLFREAARAAGCDVTTRELPWRRLLGDLEAGRMDAAMGASLTAEREAFARFTKAYRNDEFVLFLRKGDAARLGTEGIGAVAGAGLRLGTVGGYEYGAAFESARQTPAFVKLIQEASGTQLNVRKLVSNRIDAFIENSFVGFAIARQEGVSDKIEAHPVPTSSDPVHFIFSRRSVPEDVVTRFDAALAAMKADGRFEAIVGRYLK